MQHLENLIRKDIENGIAVLRLDLAPSHPLTAQMRTALDAALVAASDDSDVAGIVLTGLGDRAANGLSGGLLVADLDAPLARPDMNDLCMRIEDCAKPVVVVLHGLTLGAGVELALAAHGRIAVEGAQLAFPGVALGVTPSGGATQRLPRLIGARAALDLLLLPHPKEMTAPGLAPLLDQLMAQGDDPVAAAVAMARDLAAGLVAGVALRRSLALTEGLADHAGNAAAVALAQSHHADNPNPAALSIVACVEAASLLPPEAGLSFEAAAFEDLVTSDVSRALRHISLSERRAAQIPALAQAKPQPVSHVALIGGGQMAAQLAVACLAAGLHVVHFERSLDALGAVQARLAQAQAAMIQAGRLTQAKAVEDLERWRGTTALADLAQASIMIEAVADILATKVQVMAALDRVAPAGAVLVTTSAALRVADIAAATARPDAVLGLRIPFPVHLSRLAEILPGRAFADQAGQAQAIATLAGLLRDGMGRFVICSGAQGGHLADPLWAALQAACLGLLRKGFSVARIDAALQSYGMVHGIFRHMDLIGLDTCLQRARLAAVQVDCGQQHLDDLDRMVLAGRTGHRAGRGFYLWPADQDAAAEGPDPIPDPAVSGLLDLPPEAAAGSADLGHEAVILRAVAAMANTGAKALDAGLALRPSDLDVAMVQVYGFPRWHGGPMQAADQIGLFAITRALGRFAADDAVLFTAHPCLAALVREGQGFAQLNNAGPRLCDLPT